MKLNALITGANRGLGLAMAAQLLEQGHQIWAVNRHQSPALRPLQEKYPAELHLFQADVTNETSIKQAVEAIANQVTHLDIVVNNAAVHLEQSQPSIEEVDFSIYLPTFAINTVGPLIVIKYALPLLRRGSHKLIANISSEAGSISSAWLSSEYSYCMSKSALNMASQILQNALKEDGIKVLAVHPGWFSSDMGGEEAPITPAAAAEMIVPLLLKSHHLTDPIFVSPTGEPIPW
jgi:NAD(P)-dependent dehydrogenase (short-subunit alcohol dehydrogenase family)